MLLPDPKRRGEIHFVIAKSLPYRARLALILIFLLAGFGAQAWMSRLAVGAVLLFCASLLAVVKGYTNDPGTMDKASVWRAGDKDQLLKILDVASKASKWDESALDLTSGCGCMTWLGLVLLGFVLYCAFEAPLGEAVVLDAAVLLFPHWITGVRTILTDAPLTVKVGNLLAIYKLWEAGRKDDENMTVQMQVAKGPKGEMPLDAKLILQRPSLGDAFCGVQVQVVLNNVQGRDYPYVYCVLVAKQSLGMRATLASLEEDSTAETKAAAAAAGLFAAKPPALATEWKSDDGMDILVIRLATSKTAGYHTPPSTVERIFRFALSQARKLKA